MRLPFNFTNVPSGQNAFAAIRKYDIHTGIDLFCKEFQSIYAIEDGVVVNILPFTGNNAESPWWNDTNCVMIEGASGVILYGEIAAAVNIGDSIKKEQLVGKVLQVLKKDKGLPMCMLHLELYTTGTREPVWWKLGEPKPENLLNPTTILDMPRYEIQVINSQSNVVNYRITDTRNDDRVATCYLEGDAEFVNEALNFYEKYYHAVKNGVIIAGVIVEK